MTPAARSVILEDVLRLGSDLRAHLARILDATVSDLDATMSDLDATMSDAHPAPTTGTASASCSMTSHLVAALYHQLLQQWLRAACGAAGKLTKSMVGKLLSMCAVAPKKLLEATATWGDEKWDVLGEAADEAVAGQVAAAAPEVFRNHLVRMPSLGT
jgi:hypothetical protein